MTELTPVTFVETDIDTIADQPGRIAVFAEPGGKLDKAGRRVNRLTKGALLRLVEGNGFAETKPGDVRTLAYPVGLAAEAVDVVHLPRNADVDLARRAGVALARVRGTTDVLALAGTLRRPAELAFGLVMRDYEFNAHKSAPSAREGAVTIMCSKPDAAEAEAGPLMAIAEGAFMTRDLTNAPANVLTTTAFADQLSAMSELGLKVDVLDEEELAKLGMRTLLCVGQGSDSPSKVVVMRWDGGKKGDAPLALVGKGVVFDTGGISLKPGAGMEDMTMDMGGAGVVAGVMRAVARRKAQANVVGLVGLVENMPSGNAVRPGDVITSMKGDTVEVINTDAEGRLVLCDVMWYAQDRFAPAAMIDLATLTGAMIIALGHENAGVFSNDDDLCKDFLKAAAAEGEGAWRMPLGPSYDKLLKSRIADMKNIGGRAAGSITAAQFLQRFVKDGVPWIHLDIAGVASVKSETTLAPVGATGWGVATLNRLISDRFESS
ncbi:leucyl aminopeptidase [Sulfitobacter sp. TSTF-M16]|uniref:Probable cytosol aminopeptidase n=1 Tax=Sulfitobacter aestuariivivens TaxID=2766981 RepID=A0A927D307_9RHOB|nr:leucyl aminopeptidase [Sulfitobacter aestuariivivens]MBD3663388.1 leucyl aminopeptidase [Sulfitobacter aestuariivivens]